MAANEESDPSAILNGFWVTLFLFLYLPFLFFHDGIGKSNIKHFLYGLYIVECKPFQINRLDDIDIFFVFLRQNDVGNAGTFCCKNFFLNATNWEDFSSQSDFSCHGNVVLDFSTGKG